MADDPDGEPARPLVWTADPDAIVEKVRRAYHALAAMGGDGGAGGLTSAPGEGRPW